VTRTIAIGTPTAAMIQNFTRVLKGHITLARAKFPMGTQGGDLDVLARFHLWQAGLDYGHGTGHGVGSFSGVHEAPPSISKRIDGTPLQAGMILSNEPGFYEEGEYGIRIESLMLVLDSKHKSFLGFKTLTLAPLDPSLIDFKMMTYPERKWLINYHLEIFEELKDGLSLKEKSWLGDIVKKYQAQK
jgi:Xaa-Pro aminopeptidase